MVIVTAHLRVKPGTQQAALEALTALVPKSRADAGCIMYDLHTTTDDSRIFLFYERWENQELLDAHLLSDHVQGALGSLDFAEEPQISMWKLEE
jgi:quinol monooxygenase YgiN